jgi:hypothetical protein
MASGRDEIRAVFDDDLTGLLERLGVLADFNGGRFKCFHSGDVLTLENLHAVFPESGQVKGVCSKSECVLALVERKTRS